MLNSPFISRAHAEVTRTAEGFTLRDLGSKNGTKINGKQIEPGVFHILKDNDVIDLAAGMAVLRFRESEGTTALSGKELHKLAKKAAEDERASRIVVDEKARDVWVDGEKLTPTLALKDFELLAFLCQRQGEACSKDEIANKVWPDEFVTDEQIEQCVRRVRKRVEPDPYNPQRIVTLRGYGYKLVSEA